MSQDNLIKFECKDCHSLTKEEAALALKSVPGEVLDELLPLLKQRGKYGVLHLGLVLPLDRLPVHFERGVEHRSVGRAQRRRDLRRLEDGPAHVDAYAALARPARPHHAREH